MRHIICDMAERLETSWLELLVLVGETGSLTAAADILGMAQPNASRRLSLLERRLGVKLFVRGARGSEPTPAGTVAINRAARVLEEIDALVEETQSVAGSGAARIMASQTISEYLMPEFLAALSATEPGIRMSFEVGNSHQVLRALRRGRIDLGFIEGAQKPTEFGVTPIALDHLVTVVEPSHPWSKTKTIEAAELARTPLVSREEGSGTREVLVRALRPLSLTPPALEVHSNAAVRTAVLSGVAPTVISQLAVAEDLRTGRLVAVTVAGIDLQRRLLAVWNAPRQKRFDAALAQLREGVAAQTRGSR